MVQSSSHTQSHLPSHHIDNQQQLSQHKVRRSSKFTKQQPTSSWGAAWGTSPRISAPTPCPCSLSTGERRRCCPVLHKELERFTAPHPWLWADWYRTEAGTRTTMKPVEGGEIVWVSWTAECKYRSLMRRNTADKETMQSVSIYAWTSLSPEWTPLVFITSMFLLKQECDECRQKIGIATGI